jgi:hypothetical protein
MKSPTFTPFDSDTAKPDNGAGTYKAEFAHLTKLLLPNYAEFSIRDAYAISRSFDIPPQQVLRMFNEWVEKLCKDGTLKKIEGVYDEPVFSVETKCIS